MDSVSPIDPERKTTFIYGLEDPRNGLIRYVGKSDNPEQRLEQHVTRRIQTRWPVALWLRKLHGLGLRPKLVVLEEVSLENWREAEIRWIAHYREMNGDQMLNAMHGGEGATDARHVTRGVDRPGAKLTDDLVLEMRMLRNQGATVYELAERFGLRVGSITSICSGKLWKHVGGPLTKHSRGGHRKSVHPRRYLSVNLKTRTVSDETVAEVRRLYATGQYSQAQLGRQFGIAQSVVKDIVLGLKRFQLPEGTEPIHRSVQRDGDANPNAKLTEDDVRQIRSLYEPRKVTASQLATRFGVSVVTIRRIISGRNWRE